MLRDIRSLANIAVIEVAQYSLALDVDAGISELQVTFVLQTADGSLSPVSAPLIRMAGSIDRLFERLGGGVCRSGSDVGQVGAGQRVLNVVPNEGNRDTRVSSIDVETSEAVEQPELRGEGEL